MLKRFIENFKWFIYDTVDSCKNCNTFIEFCRILNKTYQTCTFWERHCRELLFQVAANYGKLLDYSLYTCYQRTRKENVTCYYFTTYFCRIKVYRIKYISSTKTDKECIYSGWGFTKNQCINAFLAIRSITADLDWEPGLCDEHYSYVWAKYALDYLEGKPTFFSEDKDFGLKQDIYLISRDIADNKKYSFELQTLMFLVLEEESDERNMKLKSALKQLLKEFDKEGYKNFSCLYR